MKPKPVKPEKLVFFLLLVYFNFGLQNGFTLQYLDLRKINEAEAGLSRAKEALNASLSLSQSRSPSKRYINAE